MRDRSGALPTQHSPGASEPHPTAPIPPAVADALAQYEAATLRYDNLAAQDPATRTPADLAAFLDAQGEIFEAVVILADHRRLDLTAPAEAASRYRQAAAHLRDLAAHADYEGCEYARDEMSHCRCQLAAAGRLDLIGAQS
jgi:hypothetical protein